MLDYISENSVKHSSGSHLQRPSGKDELSLGRNDLCNCGSGRKFKKCCTKGSSTKNPFPENRFVGHFGLQVHINGQCMMTFTVPNDRFIGAIDLIRAKGIFKEDYLSMVNWNKISFGDSDEFIFSVCFHVLAATLIDCGVQDLHEALNKSWIMNIPSNHSGKVETISFSHISWFEIVSDLAGVNFQ